jgi:DNA repair protein RecO (recombination protein O)
MSSRPLHAVVVKTVDVGDAHQVVHFLSHEEGQSSVFSRNARSSKKRFAGVWDLGNQVRVYRARGKGELPTVKDVDLVATPRQGRQDIMRIGLLAYGLEVCWSLAPANYEAPRLFRLALTWLDLLEQPVEVGRSSRLALEAKALTFAGLTPGLVRCVRCQGELQAPLVFEPGAGGVQHQHCGPGVAVTAEAMLAVERLRRTPLMDTLGGEWSHAHPWVLSDFIRYHLGHDLKSRAFLESIG